MNRISTFSERIKEYRTINGFTLTDMAERTGVPAQTLSRYELNQRIPKIDTAIEIADSLNIHPLWLQGYDVGMERPAPKEGSGPPEQDLINLWMSLAPEDVLRAKDFALGLIAARGEPLGQNE